MKHYTRFRAYQLGEKGASFSISVDQYFVLIEARYNSVNKSHIIYEMGLSGDVHSPTTLFEFGHYITCMTMDYYI